MTTLLHAVNAAFSSELIRHLASRMGEGEGRIRKALDAMVPLVFRALINKANSGASEVVYSLSQQAFHCAPAGASSVTGVLSILGSGKAVGGALWQADVLLTSLFGSRAPLLPGALSEYAHINLGSAEALLKLVGAVVPAIFSAHATTQKMGAQELAVALRGLQSKVKTMQPQNQPALMAKLVLPEVKNKVSSRGWYLLLPGQAASFRIKTALWGLGSAVGGFAYFLSSLVRHKSL